MFRSAGDRPTRGLRRAAFHAERPEKDSDQTVEGLRARWHSRAVDHDLDPADLARVIGRARTAPQRDAVDRDELSTRLGITEPGHTPVGVRDLVAVVANASPSGLPATEVEQVADALERSASGLPELDGDVSSGPSSGRGGRDGMRWTAGDLDQALAPSPATVSRPDPGASYGRGIESRVAPPLWAVGASSTGTVRSVSWKRGRGVSSVDGDSAARPARTNRRRFNARGRQSGRVPSDPSVDPPRPPGSVRRQGRAR